VGGKDFRRAQDLLRGGLARLARDGGAVALGPLWEEIAGEQIAKHVRAIALEGDALILEADNPRWRSEMAVHQAALLARLAEALGPSAPSRLSVRVPK
jgi:predicted nucleic acid-binding Zn ribbon protein